MMQRTGTIALLAWVYVAGMSTHVLAQGAAATVGPRACTNPFAAGPLPSAAAPAAVAFDPATDRLYVVHRAIYGAVSANAGQPTNLVSIVNTRTGVIVTTVSVGASVNGLDQGIAVDSARNRIYATNADDGTVSVINGSANPPAVVATVTVASNPVGVAVDSGVNRVYVASSSAVTVLDATTAAVLGSVSLSGKAGAVAVDTTAHKAYVAESGSQVAVINGTLLETEIPLSLAISPKAIAVADGARVYAAYSGSGIVSIIDISRSRPAEIGRIYGLQSPSALAIDPATGRLYVVESGANRVTAWTSEGSSAGPQVAVQRLPSAIAIDTTLRRAYVTDTLLDGLTIVNVDTLATTGRILLGTLDAGLAYDEVSTNKRLYAANYAAGTISVIDPTTCELLANWPVGDRPWSVAVDPVLQQLYSLTVLQGRGTVHVLSTASGARLTQIDVGYADAGRLAVNRTTHLVYVTSGSVSASTVTVINGNRLADGGTTIAVGSRPVGVAIDETSNRVYVANQQSGTISVIDGGTGSVSATWRPPRSNVWGLAVDPDVGRLYVSVPASLIGDFNGLEVLDSRTGTFIAEVQVQVGLSSETYIGLVAVNRRTHRVFVTEGGGNAVASVNPSGWTATITPLGWLPHDLVVDEAAGVVFVGNAGDGTIAMVADSGTQGGATTASSPIGQVDLNGDQAGDIFTYAPSTGDWSIELGDAQGAFSGIAGNWATGWRIEAGDFNADGKTDFFLWSAATGRWFKAIANGSGGFTYFTSTWTLGWTPYVLDLDGDGMSDVFLFSSDSGVWFKCISTGSGTGEFSYSGGAWSTGWELYPADFNGDGAADLFLFSRSSGQWFRATNDRGSGFTYSGGSWSTSWDIYPGDYNGDGRTDIFLYAPPTGQYFFCTNNGTTFTYVGGTMSANWTIRVGFFDDNVAADLFLYNVDTGYWFELTDTGTFSGRWGAGWQVFVTRLNPDSLSDLLLYSDATGQWFQAINAGTGGFRYTSGTWARGLTIIAFRPRLP